jgi:uncharacterized membrane protein
LSVISETVFSAIGNTVLVAWIALVAGLALAGRSPRANRLIWFGGWVVPLALAAFYVLLFAVLAAGEPRGDLFSLGGIIQKFSSSDHLFLLYVEVLTFSLFIARWIIEDSRRRSFPRWAVMLILPLQFLLGPAGLVAYMAASRGLQRRRAKGSEVL